MNRLQLRKLGILSGFCLLLVFWVVVSIKAANAQTPPPRPTQPPPPPSAKIVILDVENMVSPKLLQPGEAMTYTVRVSNQGTLEGSNIRVELPLVADQKFKSFEANGSGFSLDSPQNVTTTVRLTRPAMSPNEDVTFRIYATVPTQLPRTILQQSITAYWQDINDYRSATFNIRVAVNQPAPTPPPSTQPPGVSPPPSNEPTEGPFAPQVAPTTVVTPTQWYFAATKHYLSNGFLAFWLQHGSVLNFGFPLSEEFSESGMTVQYFQNVVLEYHPENPPGYEVLLRSLGRELDKTEPALAQGDVPSSGSIFFNETGHWLDGRFVTVWQNFGGLFQFGYPIAEPKIENGILTQWFERTRFELDLTRPSQLVDLAQVGREYAIAKGYLKN